VCIYKGKVRRPWRHKSRTGHEVYLYSFFNLGTRWGWVVNSTPRPLYPQETNPVPTVYEAGWALQPPGQERKISPPPGFDPRTVQLYRLRYPSPCTFIPTRTTHKLHVLSQWKQDCVIHILTTSHLSSCTSQNSAIELHDRGEHLSSRITWHCSLGAASVAW
jgi:hypothetical protein